MSSFAGAVRRRLNATRARLPFLAAFVAIVALGTACQPVKKAPPPQLPPPPPELSQPPPGSPLPLTQERVLAGLNTPWDIAFLPDDTLIFTEKRTGELSRIDATGNKDVIGTIPVHAASATSSEGVEAQHAGHIEAGLLGVAVHPDFPTPNWIYLCFTTDDHVEVQRYVLDTGTWTINDASQPAITTLPLGEIHHGCRPRFQPGTGHLFITTGDAIIPTAAQDPNSLGGKVLRVDENLAPVGGTMVYTRGHRNVQGLAFGPGGVYTTEHGPDRNDEVNRLSPGGNAGWDPNGNGFYDQYVPMTDLVKFPDAIRPVWRSGDSGTLAPSGAAFLPFDPRWGSWQGDLAVVFLKGRRLTMMFMNPDGTINSTWSHTAIAQDPSTGRFPRLRGGTLGPDGSLYVATDAPVPEQGDTFSGAIWKLTPP